MTGAILFDLDDTLLVDDAARDAALVATVATAGGRYRLEPAALAATVRQRAAAIWRDGPVFPYCYAIGITSGEGLWGHFAGDDLNVTALRGWTPIYRQQVWAQALQEHGVDDPSLAASLGARFPHERRARLALFPETVAVLRELRHGYRLAIITNGAPDLQREKIETTGLATAFDAITISGDLGIGKPRSEIFALTLDRLGVTAAEAVMVGNDLGRDVAGAHNAGLRAIWIERGASEGGPAATPDATIASLSELPPLCAAWSPAPDVAT